MYNLKNISIQVLNTNTLFLVLPYSLSLAILNTCLLYYYCIGVIGIMMLYYIIIHSLSILLLCICKW